MNKAPSSFDPIDFLNLQSLSLTQKKSLRPAILADMTAFLIERFVEELPVEKQDNFLLQLEQTGNNPQAVITLINKTNPEFDTKKIELLNTYRENFKLQKFINYL